MYIELSKKQFKEIIEDFLVEADHDEIEKLVRKLVRTHGSLKVMNVEEDDLEGDFLSMLVK